MKKLLLILITLLLSGCTHVNTDDINLSFDINLSSLDYKLPYHTKICLPENKYSCSKNGCKKIKPTVFVLYDEYSSTIYRCDERPCDSYSVDAYSSGIFTYLRPKNAKELSIKIADDPTIDSIAPEMKNEYVEVAGSMLSVMISTGMCNDK